MNQLAIAMVATAIGLSLMLADLWAQGILVAVAGMVGPALFRRPDVMAITSLALAPVQIDLGGGITPVKFWAPLALAAAILESFRTGVWRLPSASVVVPFVFFAVWAMVGETMAMTIEPAILILTLTASFIQILMVWRAASRPGGLRRVAIGYTLVSLALALSIPLMHQSSSGDLAAARAAGFCAEPNWTGETAARILPFGLALFLDQTNAKLLRALGTLGVIAAVYSEFASASRGGTLAMVAATAAFGLATSNNVRSAMRGMLLLVALAATLFYFAPEAYAYRVLGSFGIGEFANEDHGDITSGRMALNSLAFETFSEAPMFGLGASGWQLRNLYLTGTVTAIHNGPLSGLVAFGIPAVAAYVIAQLVGIAQFVRNFRVQGPERIYLMAAFAHLVSVIVSSQSLTDIVRNLVWVAPALVVAGARAFHEVEPASPAVRAAPTGTSMAGPMLRPGAAPALPIRTI